ncbi:MAG: amidohydrolase family protein [Alphaproteobacteria bacterium]|nr:amidohydrolase family protein [Alphaproteobacteria bacterium]
MSRSGLDGGVFFGRDETTGREADATRLLSLLDACGVERALAAAYRAIWFDDREGNATMREAAARSGGRLIPMAAINLTRHDPFDGYLEQLKRDGFAAIALVAGVFGWTLQDYAFRSLARDAARLGLPLQLCVRERRDLAAAADGAGAAGGTVMIRWMRGGGYTNLPDLLAIARDCPRFLFDVATITQSGGIAHLVERIGPARLFVASNAPNAHAGAGWFMLRASGLDADARRLIGGANLARALGLPEPDTAPEPRAWRALAETPKIDTHWHTSGWNLMEPRTGFEDLSATMRGYALTRAVTSSIRALSDSLEAGNAETAEFLAREPRARGLVVVNPRRPEASIAEIERWRAHPGFVGAKTIQDFYGLRLDDPAYRPILVHLAALPDFPIKAHLPGLKEAALAHPRLQFVAAHSTWRHRELASLPNVWFDISTSTGLVDESDIGDLIAAVGVERVLFSSDAPLMDPAWTLGKLALLDLSAAALDAILRRNAPRAFPRLEAA